MSYHVIIKPEAEADLDDACHWYEEQRSRLGNDFLLCVEEALEKVRHTPLAFTLVDDEARAAMVRRFPYVIYYLIEDETVFVLAILHGGRDPRIWKERLEPDH